MGVACVGALVFDDQGRLLVVRRGHEPSAGLWSVPGGRVEPQESLESAAQREVREETGLDVRLLGVVGTVELAGPGEIAYDVTDFLAEPFDEPAAARAGDDATEVAWVTRDGLRALDCSPGLVATLEEWGVWPGSRA